MGKGNTSSNGRPDEQTNLESLVSELEEKVSQAKEEPPETPEQFSSTLDDLEAHLSTVRAAFQKRNKNSVHVIVCDTGSQLNEFERAQGVWTDYRQKEWTTHILDEDGEVYSIYAGDIVYCVPQGENDEIPDAEKLKEEHTNFDGENTWGVEY